jgi:hypothetical protein
VSKAGGIADDDPNSGPAIAPGGHLFDLAIVEDGRRTPTVLDKHLGELSPIGQACGENPLNNLGFEHVASNLDRDRANCGPLSLVPRALAPSAAIGTKRTAAITMGGRPPPGIFVVCESFALVLQA